MEVTSRKEKKFIVVLVTGRIDAITAPEFETYLAGLMTKGEKHFLVNLTGLDYISSAGLRSVLATAKKLKSDAAKSFSQVFGDPQKKSSKFQDFTRFSRSSNLKQ